MTIEITVVCLYCGRPGSYDDDDIARCDDCRRDHPPGLFVELDGDPPHRRLLFVWHEDIPWHDAEALMQETEDWL